MQPPIHALHGWPWVRFCVPPSLGPERQQVPTLCLAPAAPRDAVWRPARQAQRACVGLCVCPRASACLSVAWGRACGRPSAPPPRPPASCGFPLASSGDRGQGILALATGQLGLRAWGVHRSPRGQAGGRTEGALGAPRGWSQVRRGGHQAGRPPRSSPPANPSPRTVPGWPRHPRPGLSPGTAGAGTLASRDTLTSGPGEPGSQRASRPRGRLGCAVRRCAELGQATSPVRPAPVLLPALPVARTRGAHLPDLLPEQQAEPRGPGAGS